MDASIDSYSEFLTENYNAEHLESLPFGVPNTSFIEEDYNAENIEDSSSISPISMNYNAPSQEPLVSENPCVYDAQSQLRIVKPPSLSDLEPVNSEYNFKYKNDNPFSRSFDAPILKYKSCGLKLKDYEDFFFDFITTRSYVDGDLVDLNEITFELERVLNSLLKSNYFRNELVYDQINDLIVKLEKDIAFVRTQLFNDQTFDGLTDKKRVKKVIKFQRKIKMLSDLLKLSGLVKNNLLKDVLAVDNFVKIKGKSQIDKQVLLTERTRFGRDYVDSSFKAQSPLKFRRAVDVEDENLIPLKKDITGLISISKTFETFDNWSRFINRRDHEIEPGRTHIYYLLRSIKDMNNNPGMFEDFYQAVYSKIGKNFLAYINHTTQNIDHLDEQIVFDNIDFILKNRYALQALILDDQSLLNLYEPPRMVNKERAFYGWLGTVYKFRSQLGDYRDHGMSEKVKTSYRAQAPNGIADFLKDLPDALSKGYKTLKSYTERFVSYVFDKVASAVLSVHEMASKIVGHTITSLKSRITLYMIEMISNISGVKKLVNLIPGISTIVYVVIPIAVLISLGLATINTMISVLKYLGFSRAVEHINLNIKHDDDEHCFKAQDFNTNAAISVIVACLASVFGVLTGHTVSQMSDYCRKFMFLVTASGAAVGVTQFLFTLLPYALQAFVLEKCLPYSCRRNIDVHDYIDKATMALNVAQVSTVNSSKEYAELIDELIAKGVDLLGEKFVNSRIKHQMSLLHGRLLVISAGLTQLRENGTERVTPFSFHLYGKPGVGKSICSQRMIERVFGVTSDDIYARPISEDYWNGFSSSKKVILMDEFMANENVKVGAEYLGLVSSNPFTPPMASLESPAVGIKGTLAEPIGVVTISNDGWPREKGVDTNALQRRRQCNIEVRVAKKYRDPKYYKQRDVNAGIDLQKIPPEVLEVYGHLEFAFKKVIHSTTDVAKDLMVMNFDQTVEYLREMRIKHLDFSKSRLRTENVTQDPSEIMSKYLLKIKTGGVDMPSTDDDSIISSIFQSVSSLASDTMTRTKSIWERVKSYFWAQNPIVITVSEFIKKDDHKGTYLIVHSDNVPQNVVRITSEGENLDFLDLVTKDQAVEVTFLKNEDDDAFYEAEEPEEDSQPLSFIQALTDEVTDFRKFMRHMAVFSLIVFLSMTIVAAYLIGSLLSYLSKKIFGFGSELLFSQSKVVSKVKKFKTAVRSFKKAYDFSQDYAQAGGINNNVVLINSEDQPAHSHALFLKDRKFLCHYHFFINEDGKLIDDGTKITVFGEGFNNSFKFQKQFLVMDEENDIAVYDAGIEKGMRQFRNIVPKFETRSDAENWSIANTILLTQKSGSMVHYLGRTSKISRGHYQYGNISFKPTEMMEYGFPTMSGMCGAPVVGFSGLPAGKIIGIHVSGNGSSLNPKGQCVRVYRDDLESLEEDYLAQSGSNVNEIDASLPNIISVRDSDVFARVPEKTSIRPSAIAEYLPEEFHSDKQLPILSRKDPRAKGNDPLVLNINKTGDIVKPIIDQELLDEVAESMQEYYLNNLEVQIKRPLTMDEAINGIPGYYGGMELNTSPGWPLNFVSSKNKPGKHSFINLKDGKRVPTDEFVQYVQDFLDKIERGEVPESRYIAYLKDELLSKNKIDEIRTRIIYCGDMVANVAFRMKFGGIMSAFLNSHGQLPTMLGLNQYSHDMQIIKDYLDQVDGPGYLAGDMKDFDKRTNLQIQRATYDILGKLAMHFCGATKQEIDIFYQHQVNAEIIVRDKLVRFGALHASGCFYTTLVNCFNNELMNRMAFAELCPTKRYEEEMRCIFHGDDLVMKPSYAVSKVFTNLAYAEKMEKYGQIYTSDIKDQPLTDEFRSFEDITFLGAHPRLVNGKYSGAIRKKALYEAPRWCKGKLDMTEQVCEQMLYLASQWDREFFETYRDSIVQAMRKAGITPKPYPYLELRRIQAARTTDSDESYSIWFAQSGKQPELTTLGLPSGVASEGVGSTIRMGDIGSVSEVPFTLSDMVRVKRPIANVEWKTSHQEGYILWNSSAPFQLLDFGEQNTMHHGAFGSFIYWKGNVELTLTLNGTQFQQGLLALYWRPLRTVPMETVKNIFNLSHLKIPPDAKGYNLKVPYIHPRKVLNTFAKGEPDSELGIFTLQVVVPLQGVGTEQSSVTVSLFASYPDSEFTIPKPINRAQGANTSIMNNNYTYNLDDSVIGNIPNQTNNFRADQKMDQDANVKLDNTPVVGGSIPTHQVFSSMSKTSGMEPTVGLTLHPKTLFRTTEQTYGGQPVHNDLSSLVSLESIFASFKWKASDEAGKKLFSTRLQLPTVDGMQSMSSVTLADAIADMFQFWRADFEFDIYVVKTSFHSGKLLFCVSYGAFDEPTFTEAQAYYNRVLDFSGENNKSSVEIPFNQQTDFLKTYCGPNLVDFNQDTSLGFLTIFVQNQLRAPSDSVPTEVSVLLTRKLKNAVFNTPRPVGLVYRDLISKNHIENYAQSAVVQKTHEDSETDKVQTHPLTEKDAEPEVNPPCRVVTFHHFEYTPRTVQEVYRRGKPLTSRVDYDFTPPDFEVRVFKEFLGLDENSYRVLEFMIPVKPQPGLLNIFAGWRGSMRYRIFVPRLASNEVLLCQAHFLPIVGENTHDARYMSATQYSARGQQAINEKGNVKSQTSIGCNLMAPVEEFSVAGDTQFIDVMVPFETIFQFLPRSHRFNEKSFAEVGYLSFTIKTKKTITEAKESEFVDSITIYSFLGDDVTFGPFCGSDFYFIPPYIQGKIPGECFFGLQGYSTSK